MYKPTRLILSPEIIRKAHDGEDNNALNYRVAKCKLTNASIVIENPKGFVEAPREIKDFLVNVVELFIGVPISEHHAVLEDLNNEFVTKMQKTVKDYADAHPSEITLPCEKHHRLPCSECETAGLSNNTPSERRVETMTKGAHRYVQYFAECPQCHKAGVLFARYWLKAGGEWGGPSFRICHQKLEYDNRTYRLYRERGFSPREAERKAIRPSKVKSYCYFGREPPYGTEKPIPSPSEIRHGYVMKPLIHPTWSTPLGPLKGEDHPGAKLRESDILEIRKKCVAGILQIRLAEQYGVSRSTIRDITKGKHWKHVTPSSASMASSSHNSTSKRDAP